MLWLILLLTAYHTLCFSAPLTNTCSRRPKRPHLLSMVYEKEVDPKEMMKKCEMLIAIPTSVPMKDIGELKKQLPMNLVTSVVGSKRIIEAVDSTPFCILAKHLPAVLHLVLFVDNKDGGTREVEIVTKWIRSLRTDSGDSVGGEIGAQHTILIAKKGHLLRLSI